MTTSIQINKLSKLEKNRATPVSIFLGLGIALFCAAAYSQDWVPVYEEPKHRLVFENDHAFILDVNLPPGYESLYHEHKLNVLYVTLTGSKVWAKPLDGNRREVEVHTGDLRFSSDNHGLPHIHQVGNIGTTPFHLIGIASKDEVSSDTTPLEGDTSGMELAIEKPHARVYRIHLKPGEKTGFHQHNLPFTEVFMSAGTLADSSGEAKAVAAGDFDWHDGGKSHSFENTGEEAIEIIEMQWR
ncbi:MAG: mannose-6-phosphate isomerase-like protein (cupin superfamily) [Gammaproteobacteria bacterium]|jgi:mannose-6-phosphate isomerase-like protein (cupin superfamily)